MPKPVRHLQNALGTRPQDTTKHLSADAYEIASAMLAVAEQLERIADILDAAYEESSQAIRVVKLK